MLEKGKISAFQMGLLMYPAVLASGFLVLPTITGQYAQNDLWLTCLPAALIGLIAVYTVTRLHELFPGQTVVQYSGRILGKIPGKIIGLVYIPTICMRPGELPGSTRNLSRAIFYLKLRS